VRHFLDARGYVEIEAPLLVVSPGLEPHLDAFEVPTGGPRRYLHTSPEYALKRLLGDGFERLYSLGPCFRDEPAADTHSPEFTMLEYYAVGLDLEGLMTETEALVAAAAEATNPGGFEVPRPFERLTVRDAFVRHANGVDPWQFTTAEALSSAARARGLRVSVEGDRWDDVFFQIFLNHVEPALGRERPVFLHRWPASQAALSRLDPADPTVALRFELYAGGFELGNAFDELIDPAEQRRRFQADQACRRLDGRQVPPIDDALIEALGRMRPTAGIALGFDRLVMWLTGATRIDDVRPQPWNVGPTGVAR
jgi:lysyl-tRNA synthetase class 2